MKHLFLLILIGLISQTIHAQQPITFERVYSDNGQVEGRRIRQTFDGGYIIAGRRNTPGVFFSNDGTLTKIDSLGNLEWLKVYGATISDDWLDDVQQTKDSGFIACGFYPELGMAENLYVFKTDKYGDTLWSKTWGRNSYDVARSIKQTFDGGYIVAGQIDSTGAILRLDTAGDTIWTKEVFSLGSISLYSIDQTRDSGFVATGVLNPNSIGLSRQLYLLRLDKHGNTIWEKNYGYNGAEYGYTIKALPNDKFIVGGYSWQPPNHYESYLLKLNSSGDTIWTKLLSIPGENGTVELSTTSNSNFILAEAEYTSSNSYQCNIAQTDSMGNLIWRRAYGGIQTENIYGITVCKDGGFAICGASNSYGPIAKMYLVKTNENGLLTAFVQLENETQAKIKIGPNPFLEFINLDLSDLPAEDYDVVLFDLMGKQIWRKSVQGNQIATIYSQQQLPKATYLLQIQRNGKVLTALPIIHL